MEPLKLMDRGTMPIRRGLGHDRADEIVGQDMRPDLLSHQLRCLAAQDIHLHRLLERP